MKKLFALALILAMTLSMAACGSQPAAENGGEQAPATQEAETPAEPQEETPAEADSAGDGAALTEEEYKTKLNDLMNQVSEITNESLAGLDMTDAAALLEAQKKLLEATTPLYQEMIDLKAPEKFAATHAEIATALEASVEVLNLTVEILENPTDANKIAELQAKVTELQPVAEQLQQALASLEG